MQEQSGGPPGGTQLLVEPLILRAYTYRYKYARRLTRPNCEFCDRDLPPASFASVLACPRHN